jgi:Tol biopolymer transport system component
VNILNAINGERTQAGPGLWVTWGATGDVFAVERAGEFVELGNPGGGRRRLVDGTLPAWSPDGRLIGVVRKTGEPGGWLALADGAKPSPIVGGGTCALSFSPSGHTMAIVTEREGMRHLVLRPITTPQ